MYDHWKGVFYPVGLRKDDWLSFYMKHFDTVEINNTFYHMPSRSAFEGWKSKAENGFVFALKGSRFITHMKKLKDPEGPLKLFWEMSEILGKNLGPVLFQLPPRWRCNAERLREFVRVLPPDMRFAFEFREPTWFNEDVYHILRERDIALCIYNMPEFQSPLEVTASFVYIRLHGANVLYGSRYTGRELSKWADNIGLYRKGGLDVYVYFNNDAEGYAVINAKELKKMVR